MVFHAPPTDFYSLGGCISPLYPSLTMNYYTCPRQCHSLKWLLQVCHTHEPSAETLDIGSGSAYIKRIRISKYIPTGQFSVWRITSRVRLMAVSSSWRPGPRAVSTVWNLVGICRRAKQLLVSQTFGQKKRFKSLLICKRACYDSKIKNLMSLHILGSSL